MSQWIDRGNYWEHTAQQGTADWLGARIGRITTCVSGAMGGVSKFKTPEEQGKIIAGVEVEDFTPEALERMGHGTFTEPEARDWASKLLGVEIEERGLAVPKWDDEIGASIDGDVIGTDGIIEIKCPVHMYWPLEQYMDQKSVGWVPPENYYKHIYPTHYCQMQQALAVTNKKWCMYIVYSTSDKKVFTQKIPFNPEFWESHYHIIKENYNKYVKPYLK
jgi:hypothetical protein